LSVADITAAEQAHGLSAELVRHEAGSSIPHHAHDFGQLSLVVTGTMSISDDNGWWLAPPGRGIWIPPGVGHSARHAESSAHIRMLISSTLAARLPQACRTLPVSTLLRELAREAITLAGSGQTDKIALVHQLIICEATKPDKAPVLFVPQGREPRLLRVVGRMRESPGRADTLEELADVASCSARTLARLFIAETGMTFTRWREHLRIVNAVDLLIRGNTITATALDLGYQSPSSFTTMFTRILGLPPARYLKEISDHI
jgi:AraC-like DNA-binding protein/quercetin dioxygenase-like cupin family protein